MHAVVLSVIEFTGWASDGVFTLLGVGLEDLCLKIAVTKSCVFLLGEGAFTSLTECGVFFTAKATVRICTWQKVIESVIIKTWRCFGFRDTSV